MKLSEKLASTEPAEEAEEVHPRPTSIPGVRPIARTPASAPADRWSSSKRTVHQKILADLAPSSSQLSTQALVEKVRGAVDEILASEDLGVSPVERRRFVQEVLGDILGYGPLDPLLADETITEIMCNDVDEIWIERAGLVERTDASFSSLEHYRRIIEKIVVAVGRRVDESSPMVDARLPDGSRVNVIVPPLAVRAPVLTIRKFPAKPLLVSDLIAKGSLTVDAATFLEACVRARINLLVSGGTGTGKTTMLNVLSAYIPEHERIITIEEAAELQTRQPHTVSLEARPPNAEGSGEVRIRDLVKNSLRMRPDRIIVGECRGGEALDMLQAMNTGHEGSMTTVHANNPRETMTRLEVMVLMAGYDLPLRAIREQIASAVEVVVHLERTPSGARVVSSITELQGMEGDVIVLQDLFRRGAQKADRTPGALVPTGLRPKLLERMTDRGVEVDSATFRMSDRDVAREEERRLARPGRFRGNGFEYVPKGR
jgi:pilus assembly protein CpaF